MLLDSKTCMQWQVNTLAASSSYSFGAQFMRERWGRGAHVLHKAAPARFKPRTAGDMCFGRKLTLTSMRAQLTA